MAEPGDCPICGEYCSLEKECNNCGEEMCNGCANGAVMAGVAPCCDQRLGDVCDNDILKTAALEPVGFHY